MNLISLSKYCLCFLLVFVWVFMNPGRLNGQLSKPGHPLQINYEGAPKIRINEIVISEDMKTNAFEKKAQSLLKPANSGILVDVNFTPANSGTWDTLSNGMKIWRTSFKVKDASMINLLFSPYQLNKGVIIYLYDRKQEVVLGAFSDINNKTFNKLATAQIPGDELIIEIQVPPYLDHMGQLGISGIGCDFTDFIRNRLLKDVFYGMSGSCNVDIHCISDPLVRELKNSVVRIIYNGTQRCTGTLVNNTLQDGAYYILTAGHCINTEDEANAAVFYFDYESPYCDGPDGKALKSLSGATLRATGDNLDFSLLELLEPIPYHYNAYYAGWDYTGKAPVAGFTIHHPNGDVKKYSQENHPISVSNYESEFKTNTHWLVRHWETGTTEPGSSGCPLFDKYGHIVGTLTGGYADCDNSVLDYFQMFSHCWDDYLSQNRQLACWLDPPEEGRGFLNGFDPFREFRLTGDTLSNILKNEDRVLIGDGLEWGSYSGHNSGYVTGFAEKYSVSGIKNMTGLILDVANNHHAWQYSKINIKIWTGAVTPEDVLYQMEVYQSELIDDAENFIELDSVVSLTGSFFVGYELEYGNPQDTFATRMAKNRPLGSGSSAYVFDNHWQTLTDYSSGTLFSSFGILPVVFDSVPRVSHELEFEEPFIAFPVPADNRLWIEFPQLTPTPLEISLVDLWGQVVLERTYGAYQRIILLELTDISSGIYVVKVKEGSRIHTLKVAVVK